MIMNKKDQLPRLADGITAQASARHKKLFGLNRYAPNN
jgi:hypothetical protein